MNRPKKIYIGIDPDVDRSGFAQICEGHITLGNMRFFELFDYLLENKQDIHVVLIEAGWLNKSNWHSTKGSAALNAKIGERTGANHETGKKILEMVEYLEINHKLSRPTRSKVDASFFKKLCGIGYRTNQEQRDAYMLIHGLN